MSASRVLPTWRPIGSPEDGRCKWPGCEQTASNRPDRYCFYHGKLVDLPGILNGADSRMTFHRGPGNHHEGPRPRYDYGTWFDGQPHTLTQGVDFAAETKAMLTMLRRAAVRLGRNIAVSYTGPVITVQAQRAEGAA